MVKRCNRSYERRWSPKWRLKGHTLLETGYRKTPYVIELLTYTYIYTYIHTSILPNIPYFIYMLGPRFVCFNVTVS
jgi:hypothetical protein